MLLSNRQQRSRRLGSGGVLALAACGAAVGFLLPALGTSLATGGQHRPVSLLPSPKVPHVEAAPPAAAELGKGTPARPVRRRLHRRTLRQLERESPRPPSRLVPAAAPRNPASPPSVRAPAPRTTVPQPTTPAATPHVKDPSATGGTEAK